MLLQQIMDRVSQGGAIKLDDTAVARVFLDQLNKYFYQQKGSYISSFHEYWEAFHEDILNVSINQEKAKEIAETFEMVFANIDNYSHLEVSPPVNRQGLSAENICNVRFFTAIQDFKIDIYKQGRDPFQKYIENPEWYEAQHIIDDESNIIGFLQYLGATGSQGDKRQKWMLEAAKFLVNECQGNAINLINICNKSILQVRELIADNNEIGYSRKKADMFIRDMIDWEVWEGNEEVSELNVASDANTMRVALRSGLVDTSIPLLASYMDVYCFQYGLVDNVTQEGWRTVWMEWRKIPNNHCPPSPASMDYLIYKSIGKACCKPNQRKCNLCILDSVCPEQKRILKTPKSISIYGMTGWESGKTDAGGGGGIMS